MRLDSQKLESFASGKTRVIPITRLAGGVIYNHPSPRTTMTESCSIAGDLIGERVSFDYANQPKVEAAR